MFPRRENLHVLNVRQQQSSPKLLYLWRGEIHTIKLQLTFEQFKGWEQLLPHAVENPCITSDSSKT